jgi:hypothetical protein
MKPMRFFRLGRDDEAWRELGEGLRGLPFILEPWLRQAVLQGAAKAALGDGRPDVALLFEDSVLHAAREARSFLRSAIALRERAATLHQLGRMVEALNDLHEAEALAYQVGDPALIADVLFSCAETLSQGDPHASLEALNQASPLVERTAYVIQRQSLRADLRASFFDQYHALFDGAIESSFAIRHDREAASAFDYSEKARSRALLEMAAPAANTSGRSDGQRLVSLADAEQQVPDHVTIVEFAVLEQSLLVWVIRRGSAMVARGCSPRLVRAPRYGRRGRVRGAGGGRG